MMIWPQPLHPTSSCSSGVHMSMPAPAAARPFTSLYYRTRHTPPSHRRLYSTLQDSQIPEGYATEPQIPLCERSPSHQEPLTSVLRWRDQATELAQSVGKDWVGENDAPSIEDLQTELTWLLDDAVAGVSFSDTGRGSGSSGVEAAAVTATAGQGTGQGAATSWKEAERLLKDNIQPNEAIVSMREDLTQLDHLWSQRVNHRVPLQYLTSCAFWRDFVLSVGPGVLIPRPETELIIDFVTEAVAARPRLATGQWADLGTGCGALAIGVARAIPSAPAVWAVDLAAEPAAHAAFNALRCGVGHRVRVVRGSWYQPLLEAGVKKLAGIVSNPPYIASEELAGLQAEVGMHEPALALAGGEGLGIDSLLPICLGAVGLLQPGGFIALETGGGEQAEYMAHLLRHVKEAENEERLAFEDVAVRRDLRGVGRFVTATRRDDGSAL